MQINTQMKQAYAQFKPVQHSEGNHAQKAGQTERQRVESTKSAQAEKTTTQSPAKTERKDTVEISQTAMKLHTESVKQKDIQDKATTEQVAQQALSSLQEHGNTLKELASKHEEAKPEEKQAIETKAKEVLKAMNEVQENAKVNGKPVLEGKHEAEIPKHVEDVDVKEFLKPENVEEKVTKPLEEAKEKVDTNVQNMVASLTASQTTAMTRTDAQTSVQKVKDSLKNTDVNKLSSALDSRRQNVAHLLR